ncbi:50S rRNA methyltransferase [Fervidicella metallireducens AeB]|uniref:Probable dual-specificity RNA methyltransferase RlmN n=1 Tax=Fervidicella metallireducens AeB TaxID=1403537 RepID=A0A017RWW6_9CLOT|nr:23S rRNA (adenine(2503)-C(2))-methyltransferase RlmN [Fervidicella metallireducens]EYE89278.1 50S rRNA methyltransferase [Fervidicella metallireducens AeB]
MIELRSCNIEDIEKLLIRFGEKNFRAKQIFKWIHRGVENIDEMTDLSKKLRDMLKNEVYICNMEIVEKFHSKIDGTMKYLMKLNDGNIIECVLMKYSFGNTICISTQAGCSMGCTFCASTIGGKNRDLTPGEMLGQVLKVQRDSNLKVSNVVLMGTGEPLDNFENVIKFIKLVNHGEGLNIGMRHLTLSTCGLVPEIKRLADFNMQITLAISLHAPNDEVRRSIMPIAYKYSFDELLDACKYYINKTGRRITFEYSLISGVNDSDDNAKELSNKLKGILCHVNLIPVNKVEGKIYSKSNKERIEAFRKILNANGIETTIRRELGSDINAACGQLRRSYLTNKG